MHDNDTDDEKNQEYARLPTIELIELINQLGNIYESAMRSEAPQEEIAAYQQDLKLACFILQVRNEKDLALREAYRQKSPQELQEIITQFEVLYESARQNGSHAEREMWREYVTRAQEIHDEKTGPKR